MDIHKGMDKRMDMDMDMDTRKMVVQLRNLLPGRLRMVSQNQNQMDDQKMDVRIQMGVQNQMGVRIQLDVSYHLNQWVQPNNL